jgi:hypothetical protein
VLDQKSRELGDGSTKSLDPAISLKSDLGDYWNRPSTRKGPAIRKFGDGPALSGLEKILMLLSQCIPYVHFRSGILIRRGKFWAKLKYYLGTEIPEKVARWGVQQIRKSRFYHKHDKNPELSLMMRLWLQISSIGSLVG